MQDVHDVASAPAEYHYLDNECPTSVVTHQIYACGERMVQTIVEV